MDSVNQSLYIPLYGKALVSCQGSFFRDPKAEEIWAREGFQLTGKSASKWLAYYMAMRSTVFDGWLEKQMAENPRAVVVHIGCGLDSRVERTDTRGHLWFDVDFPEVIRERKKYYSETESAHMLPADMRQEGWKAHIPGGQPAIVVMEGVSMYFRPEELEQLLRSLALHFSSLRLLMDCYSGFAARASKYKNPINEVGVTSVYGMDNPVCLAEKTGLSYVGEHDMTPLKLIAALSPGERIVFSALYGGKLARSLYRLHEFKKK